MIILASKSPRRQRLLELITDDFEIRSADVDETLPYDMGPAEAVEYLSKIKAAPFAGSGNTVIGADTVVAADGDILGKPANDRRAFEMLKRLSGREHSVFTGVTVIRPTGDSVTFSCETRVKFFRLTDDDINNYIESGECFDKAGAYAIQGRGALFVEGITGDYFNVVGLPVSRLNKIL